jgi:hypothetical protein
MKASTIIAAMSGLVIAILSFAMPARAQIIGPPGTQPVIPFPTAPPPPPPPRIEVPQVPQMNSPPPFALQNTTPGRVTSNGKPPRSRLKPARRESYGDRIARCLDEGAAWGLGPNERAAYSRSCANR